MSYTIIFETKIINLSDGRLLHLERSGCNNDTSGRTRDEFYGKIYTKEEFMKLAENYKKDNKPYSKSDGFSLKIGSRYCTYYDYGEHLLRMLKRATTWDQLCSERYCSCTIFDGVRVTENNVTTDYTPNEWSNIAYDFHYGRRKGRALILNHTVRSESEIIKELDSNPTTNVSFYIGKKIKYA